MEGWIQLHRKLLTSETFQNEKQLKVFIYCLLKATHTEHEQRVGRQKINLKPGQFVFGRKAAALEMNMKESTIRDYINLLQDDKIITINSTNKYSVITVVNWGFYQTNQKNSDSKSDNKKTTDGQQINTNNNVKKGNNELLKPSSHKYETCDMQNAELLFKLMQQNNAEVKKPNFEKWANDFRLIRERDGKELNHIKYFIEWSQKDSFWKTNILSPSKLRAKWDQLFIKAKQEHEESQQLKLGSHKKQNNIDWEKV